VGNRSPNKNIARLVAAHRRLGDGALPLVIAGGAVPGLADAGGGAGARYLGRVSDSELRALYAAADGFLFPSLHEGFGIPPLEAMALGVPVLAARRAAMPEVLGDAAMWFDPMSVADMTRAMCAFADMAPDKRARMIAAGRVRAAGFNWAESAARLISLLRRAQAGVGIGVAGGAGPGLSASCAPEFPPADKAANRPAG
jgi:glycosyltransferase involved in cell wall biosynthesis